jgi:hypothetical protein
MLCVKLGDVCWQACQRRFSLACWSTLRRPHSVVSPLNNKRRKQIFASAYDKRFLLYPGPTTNQPWIHGKAFQLLPPFLCSLIYMSAPARPTTSMVVYHGSMVKLCSSYHRFFVPLSPCIPSSTLLFKGRAFSNCTVSTVFDNGRVRGTR